MRTQMVAKSKEHNVGHTNNSHIYVYVWDAY